ncbi:MAG TPA: hypothetical protein VGE50_06020 [Gammaproteobacteria bacterium]
MADLPLWRTIAASHPALPGHFPGHPIVPGVVILSEVWDALCASAGRPLRCTGWPSVKFLAPLHPNEPFTVELEFTGVESARFTCRSSERPLASGTVHFAARPGAEQVNSG